MAYTREDYGKTAKDISDIRSVLEEVQSYKTLKSLERKLSKIMEDIGEPVGQCESCGECIFEGDKYSPCNDEIMLCEEHGFMLSDAVKQLQEFADEGEGDHDMRSHDEVVEDLLSMRSDLEENGDRKVLYTA